VHAVATDSLPTKQPRPRGAFSGFAGSVTAAHILERPSTIGFTDMRELPRIIEQG